MSRLAAMLALVLSIGLAGCASPATPVKSAAVSATAADAPTGAGSRVDASKNMSAEAVTPAIPIVKELKYDGQTGTFACAFVAVTGACQGQFSQDSFRPLEMNGAPLTAEGKLSWQTSSPTATQMQVVILVKNGSNFDQPKGIAPAQGASPLSFHFDITSLAGKDVFIDVNSFAGAGAGPGFVGGSLQQPFHLEGTYAFRPLTQAPAS